MPTPFHAMRDHRRRPQEVNSEPALLLERHARIDHADASSQLRQQRRNSKRRSGRMNIAAVRLACATCLLLIVLAALASKASAMPGSWPQPTTTSSGEIRSSDQLAAYGSQLGHLAVQPSQVSDHTSYAFNWADASVGAAFGALLVPLLAGGVLLLNRGRANTQSPARSRPR
jgi:hypothetical protein